MFGFDKMFDFNRDGHLDSFERAAQFRFMDDMMKHEENDSFDDDEEDEYEEDDEYDEYEDDYELDNEEWPGVEITPVKITFTARTSDFVNNTMRYFWNIPAHGIRAADFIFKNEIIKGTLFFTFPLNEKNN